MKEKIRLGQTITVDHSLIREYRGYSRNWEKRKRIPKEVIVIGVRTLHNGRVEYENDIKFFVSMEKFKALLVVENLKNKPFCIKYEESDSN